MFKAQAYQAWLGLLDGQAKPEASYKPAILAWLGLGFTRLGLAWLGLEAEPGTSLNGYRQSMFIDSVERLADFL